MIEYSYEGTAKNGFLIVLIGMGKEKGKVLDLSSEMLQEGAAFLFVEPNDWNRDLSPWKAPKIFRGGDDFSGEGDHFLNVLISEILPATEKELPNPVTHRLLAGYSMAGLFALWASIRCDRFDGVISVSGSLWFEGFLDYALNTPFLQKPFVIDLSVGDREKKTHNKRLQTVESATRELASHYKEKKILTFFTLNEGGHFDQPTERTVSALKRTYHAFDPLNRIHGKPLDKALFFDYN